MRYDTKTTCETLISMAHPDLDELVSELIPFAQLMLAKAGEFYPSGGTMGTEGDLSRCGAWNGDEHPQSEDLVELFSNSFCLQAAEGRIRASAICIDSRTIPPGGSAKTDAICILLDHESGQSIDVFLPYRKGWFGKYKYGDLFACQGGRSIFGESRGADQPEAYG